jgi:hypothetical protein
MEKELNSMLDSIDNQLYNRGIIKKKFDYEETNNLPTYYTDYFRNTLNSKRGFYETEMKIRNDPNFLPTYSYTELSNLQKTNNLDLLERQKILDTNLMSIKEFETRKLIEHELEPYLQNIRMELKNTIDDFKKEFEHLTNEKNEIENMKKNISENTQRISKLENDFQFLTKENIDRNNFLQSEIERKNNNLFNEVNSKFYECDFKIDEMNKKINDINNKFHENMFKNNNNINIDNDQFSELENKLNEIIENKEKNLMKEINKNKENNLLKQKNNLNNNIDNNNLNELNDIIEKINLDNNTNNNNIKQLNKNLQEINKNLNNLQSEKNNEILLLKQQINKLYNENKKINNKFQNMEEFQIPEENKLNDLNNEEHLNNLENKFQSQLKDVSKQLVNLLNNVINDYNTFKNEQIKLNEMSQNFFSTLSKQFAQNINDLKNEHEEFDDNFNKIQENFDIINLYTDKIPKIENNIKMFKDVIQQLSENYRLTNEQMQKGFDENANWQKELVNELETKINDIKNDYDNKLRQTLSLNNQMIDNINKEKIIKEIENINKKINEIEKNIYNN